MTIPAQLQAIVSELISKYGIGYKISLKELYALMKLRYDTNPGSVIPSDYCYNRANKGIVFTKYPHLFVHVKRGIYECLGEGYPYNGPVYAKPKNSKSEFVIGTWENGTFLPNANWNIFSSN